MRRIAEERDGSQRTSRGEISTTPGLVRAFAVVDGRIRRKTSSLAASHDTCAKSVVSRTAAFPGSPSTGVRGIRRDNQYDLRAERKIVRRFMSGLRWGVLLARPQARSGPVRGSRTSSTRNCGTRPPNAITIDPPPHPPTPTPNHPGGCARQLEPWLFLDSLSVPHVTTRNQDDAENRVLLRVLQASIPFARGST